jgi:hypothetical protein
MDTNLNSDLGKNSSLAQAATPADWRALPPHERSRYLHDRFADRTITPEEEQYLRALQFEYK